MSRSSTLWPRRLLTAAAAVLTALLVGSPAAGATPVSLAPPGPVTDLVATPVAGGGARSTGLKVSWTPGTDDGEGARTRYEIEVHDVRGATVYSGATGATESAPIYGDYCRAPFRVSVRAVTRAWNDSGAVPGAWVHAEFGQPYACAIHLSLDAKQSGPSAVTVQVRRLPPVDPYVSGPCRLTAGHAVLAVGTCGGQSDTTLRVEGLSRGSHQLTLTTDSPRGDRYMARALAVVR